MLNRAVLCRLYDTGEDSNMLLAVETISKMMSLPDINTTVRLADIGAFLVEHYRRVGQLELVGDHKIIVNFLELSLLLVSQAVSKNNNPLRNVYK